MDRLEQRAKRKIQISTGYFAAHLAMSAQNLR